MPATVNRLLVVAAGYLEEGMAETRMHGKGILCGLSQVVPGTQLAALLDKCVAKASLRRKVDGVCLCKAFKHQLLLVTHHCSPRLL